MRKLFSTLIALCFIVGIAYAGPEGKHVDLNGVDVIVYYPHLSITPGIADHSVTQDKIRKSICVSEYTKDKRKHQTSKVKKTVLANYDVSWEDRAKYEDDHLIALTDGECDCCDKKGKVNDTDCSGNRWPDFYCAPGTGGKTCFGASEKDVVESHLNRQVCKGKITLRQAQEILRNDWFAEYVKIKGLVQPN